MLYDQRLHGDRGKSLSFVISDIPHVIRHFLFTFGIVGIGQFLHSTLGRLDLLLLLP